jgi:hypothetical protein
VSNYHYQKIILVCMSHGREQFVRVIDKVELSALENEKIYKITKFFFFLRNDIKSSLSMVVRLRHMHIS